MAEFVKTGQNVPAERVVSPAMPGPGYAVMQQGNMVVHQAKGLREEGERITMVNGYVAADARIPDFTRYDQLRLLIQRILRPQNMHNIWVFLRSG